MRARSGRSSSLGGIVLATGAPRRARDFLAASAYVPQVPVGGKVAEALMQRSHLHSKQAAA